MARMRGLAQRIDDPDVEPSHRGDALGRQALDVGRVGHFAEAEAQGWNVSVVLQDRQHVD